MDRDTALMTSTGSAICGAAAVLGAEPVVRCEGYKTAIAVSTVVIFGTLSMFLYPASCTARACSTGLTDTGVAVYTGSDAPRGGPRGRGGQRDGPDRCAGNRRNGAAIAKMIRVMLLAPVLVVMGFVLAGRRKSAGGRKEKNKIAVPWFAFGFIGVICRNSLLQYLFGVESVREIPLNGVIEYADTFMLTMAMTALGHRDEPRQIQAGRSQAFRAGGAVVCLAARGRLLRHEIPGRSVVTAVLRQPGQRRGFMLRIAQHPFPHEVREIAGFFVREGPGTAHQHEPVGVERLRNEGWIYSWGFSTNPSRW